MATKNGDPKIAMAEHLDAGLIADQRFLLVDCGQAGEFDLLNTSAMNLAVFCGFLLGCRLIKRERINMAGGLEAVVMGM